MDGMSSIEIDIGGIYLSLPVSTETVSTGSTSVPLGLEDTERTESRSTSSRIFNKGVTSLINLSSYTSTTKKDKKLGHDSRMILHIPPSDKITVFSTQPTSLVISIPLLRTVIPSSNATKDRIINSFDSDMESRSSTNITEDESIDNVLTHGQQTPQELWSAHGQQTPQELGPAIAPWSYIQSHSERAVDVTEDDEVEASDFALTLASLERYIATLPATAIDVKILIHCMDRLQRDSLVLAVRALAAQLPTASSEMRRKAFSWDEGELDSNYRSPYLSRNSMESNGPGSDGDLILSPSSSSSLLSSSLPLSLPLSISSNTAVTVTTTTTTAALTSKSIKNSSMISSPPQLNTTDDTGNINILPACTDIISDSSINLSDSTILHLNRNDERMKSNLQAQYNIREVSTLLCCYLFICCLLTNKI